MLELPIIYAAKLVRAIAKLRGGGSALPGLFIEKLDPGFVGRTLSGLDYGVVVVSGTNGKTTTAKIAVKLLEGQGLKVFTNRTGSNFSRGVAAALLGEVDVLGRLQADIAVLELDEAHAVHFVHGVPPRYSLLLNVMRDQLDRFGEVATAAKMLASIAQATTGTVVINREDPQLLAIGQNQTDKSVRYFGLNSGLRAQFPSDDDMRSGSSSVADALPPATVVLERFNGSSAVFGLGSRMLKTDLKLTGIYNTYNAAAALALVREIMGSQLGVDRLMADLASVTPAFGRGESLLVNGLPLELVLVKNPGGFRLGLKSFVATDYQTMIAINDNFADGRDMSWLWDVDFESLQETGVAMLSGGRAYDMALRLQYDEVSVGQVEPSLSLALRQFVAANPSSPKRIYCTYSAMLALRRELAKITKVEAVS